MADSTISQLPAAITIGGTDLIPIDQGGVTKKAPVSLLGLLTLNIATGKTLTVLNSLTLAGTDGTSMIFPSTTATIARTDAAQTFAGTQTFIDTINGSINGNAASASTLANTDDTTTSAAMYPLWTATVGGNYAAKVSSTKLTFNPSSGVLTATGFSGPLTGNVAGNCSGTSGSTTGNAATATALQTGRTIDGTTFDGTVNILVVAPAIHAATNKTTPVDADEFGIWDSVSTLLNHVTWANIKATLLGVIAGKAVQVDQVVTAWTRAATTTLGTSLNGTISNTSTTITAFNGVAGVTYHVRALGGGQITHNATDLIITQGEVDRITAAGDTFDVEMLTATTCRVKNYITSAGLSADIGAAIHAATNKTTPVDADEIGIWDSVSGLLNYVTWANLKTTLGGTFAALAGLSTQVFSVATATSAAHAVRLDQRSDPYILIRDEKADTTIGGTFTSGAWKTRTLNTIVADTSSLASLASNQITLTAGTYRFKANAPAWLVDRNLLRLQNITAGTTILVGGNSDSGATSSAMVRATIEGEFTIAASQALELQHRCQSTTANEGFGLAMSFGVTEVYAVIEFWKKN
jgi:hypothetical protein